MNYSINFFNKKKEDIYIKRWRCYLPSFLQRKVTSQRNELVDAYYFIFVIWSG